MWCRFTSQRKAQTSPNSKRVIVISADKVAMEPTLDEAIQSVFGTQQTPESCAGAARATRIGSATAQFDVAQKAMQQGIGKNSAKRWRRSALADRAGQ